MLRFLAAFRHPSWMVVLLRFMLSWEASQRSQGSSRRTVQKVDVSNAFINSDLPENRLVLDRSSFTTDLAGILASRHRMGGREGNLRPS